MFVNHFEIRYVLDIKRKNVTEQHRVRRESSPSPSAPHLTANLLGPGSADGSGSFPQHDFKWENLISGSEQRSYSQSHMAT